MPPEITGSSILRGQKALIVGVANDRSIAWGCAEAMHRAGAEIAMTYLNDKARPHVEPLASAVEASLLLPLEVRDSAQVDALFEAIASQWASSTFSYTRSPLLRGRRWKGGSPIAPAMAS